METKRRLQLGAALSIVNGLLALTVLSSGPALAATCGPLTFCIPACTGAVATCEANTPAGCTYVSTTCAAGCPNHQFKATCTYQ
jgi:hypothetical protein